MINRLLIVAASLSLIACATAARGPAVASYHESVSTVAATNVHGACADVPADRADHRDLVPLANACVKAQDWARVEAYGEALATRATETPWGAYFLALSARERRDYPRARWMIDRALSSAPDQALFHYELARLMWATHDDSGVAAEMKLAAKLGPDLAEAHVFEGQSALRREDFALAKRELDRALAVEPKHHAALLALAEAQLKSNDFAGAEDALTRVIAVEPRHAVARLELARVQETHLKKFEEALRTLKDVRRLSAERKLDGAAPADLFQRIESLEKTVAQAQRDQEKSRMPSAERK